MTTDNEKQAVAVVDEAIAITRRIKPMLADTGYVVQGAVLCQLLGLFLACFPHQLRCEELRRIFGAAIDLAHINENRVFGEKGHPANDDKQIH
jgi:hypothetical protein